MGITKKLVEFCASVKYENLSSEIVDRVKYHWLDFLGVASRGSLVESSKAVYRLVKDIGLSPQGTAVCGSGQRHISSLAGVGRPA